MNRISKALGVLLVMGTMLAQTGQRSAAVRPAPRNANGRVNLGTVAGENGHWIRQGRAQLATNSDSVIAAGPGGLSTNLQLVNVPFQPWARALFISRQDSFERDAPHSRCKPS